MLRALTAGLAIVAAACTPAEETSAPGEDTPTASSAAEGKEDKIVPQVFAATAWRTAAADGTRFTTYLDPDKTYRDLRNGDPWQVGTWIYEREGSGRLCLTPAAENAIERCWTPGRIRRDILDVTSDDGRRIELEKVEYAPPASEIEDAA